MATIITDECISCGACEAECPQGAIFEGDEHFEVDPSKCDSCKGEDERACAAVCPVEACVEP